jgi:F0F1-type ATP synthase assembly protein I
MPWWVVALRLTGLGWYIAACVVVGVLGGIWLDNLLGSRIIFTLLGIILGSVAAFWGVYKMVLPILYGAKHQEMTRKRRDR